MTPREIFSKTLPFCWAKLLLGAITIGASVLILAVFLGLAMLFNSSGILYILFILWICITAWINFALNHYVGYLVKAGHVAVMTEAVVTGQIPENQVEYGKQMVTERFLTSNVYFIVDKLVSGAVRQLQNLIGKVGGMLDSIPGVSAITNIAQMFVGISLGYIDECCLGYTFYNKEQGAFKSAADGVVIYAQNIKGLMISAAKTTGLVIVTMIALTLVTFVLIAIPVNLLKLPGFIAFIIAIFIAAALKTAFVDSWIMARMISSYMQVAPTTEITYDLYGKLCKVSNKFKELIGKAKEEGQRVASDLEPQSASWGQTTQQRDVWAQQAQDEPDPDLDWLNPQSQSQQPVQQRPAQQRPVQQRPAQQRPAQQRPVQQQPSQQRPAPTQPRPTQPVAAAPQQPRRPAQPGQTQQPGRPAQPAQPAQPTQQTPPQRPTQPRQPVQPIQPAPPQSPVVELMVDDTIDF